MHPRLFTVPAFPVFGHVFGPLVLPTYGVLLAIGFLAGLWMAGRQARRAGLDDTRITDMAIYVLIAGLLGAKALLIVVEWNYFWRHPRELFSVLQSGGVFYGGLLAAFPVAWWYARRHQLDGWRTADVLAPGVVLGQAVGRLGCLAAGCCHGRQAVVPWAITFHDVYANRQVGTPLDVPLHPTQIYESVACFLILAVLLWLTPRKKFHGQVALAYVSLYSVARFAIEYYRGDLARGTLLNGIFSTSQGIAIVLFFGALALIPYLAKRKRIEPPPPAA